MQKNKLQTLGRRITSSKESKSISFFTTKVNSLKNFYKKRIVYRLFWGRSNLYKNVTHLMMLGFTLTLFLSGFTNRFFAANQSESSIISQRLVEGNIDLLAQGTNIQSILLAETTRNFKIIEHTVQEGENYNSIAELYDIEIESIKLSNLDKINYYAESPSVGTVLRIPEINGVLLTVGDGENIDTLMSKLTKGQRLDVIEINNLKAPDYTLTSGSLVLVPDGLVAPPPPPVPQIRYTAPPPPAPIPSPGNANFAGVFFIDPLSHPSCGGYGYSRGFSSWHNGVDLTRRGGCPIRASASGTVEFAGWSSGGEGFMVRINHGNGVQTLYFHGDGQIWVSPGQYVAAGTDIMNMGCTGFCTGTHLHLSLRYNGAWIDPSPYIPYWRP